MDNPCDVLIEKLLRQLAGNRELPIGQHHSIRQLQPGTIAPGWLVSKDGFPAHVSLTVKESLTWIFDSRIDDHSGQAKPVAVSPRKQRTRRLDIPKTLEIEKQEHHG